MAVKLGYQLRYELPRHGYSRPVFAEELSGVRYTKMTWRLIRPEEWPAGDHRRADTGASGLKTVQAWQIGIRQNDTNRLPPAPSQPRSQAEKH